ncbi:voltage-gated potassium channel [Caballeronia temeraria]|uniref:Voltage-gated potassium channel n=1 Tax=Caballeronia temeraria TaxID=1777137 RepID=A0A158ARG5_9BURK|nr:potassium channel family protein [Caballeronia temeraria]SAK60424.1 voltage-gated potassium channel [Caballeronia temeraria]
MRHWLRTLGSYGVAAHDAPAAVRAWHRMRWPLFAALLLCIPAFYLELLGLDVALGVARGVYALAGMTCSGVLCRMLALTRHRATFLRRNALDVGLTLAALASISGGAVPWSGLEWILRLSFMGALALRIVLTLRALFVPHRLLILLAIGALLLLLAGAGFYCLEPRVHSYADGLWLAFESSATVGYGDIAPTTPASRVFAVFIVLLGYGMLSLTFASIAALFIGEEEKQLRRDMHRDIKRLEAEVAGMRDDLRALHGLLARAQARDDAGVGCDE